MASKVGRIKFPAAVAIAHPEDEEVFFDPSLVDPLAKYKITGIDPDGVYFGYTDKDGAWYIMKLETGVALYVKGDDGYLEAWADKEHQSYDYYFNIF